MGGVQILKGGLLTTVQDAGRWGFQAWGVPIAGAMDLYSYRAVNALVGNDPGAAALEVTMIGPHVQFEVDAIVAVAGAPFEVTVDSTIVPMNEAVAVRRGARLRFGGRSTGVR